MHPFTLEYLLSFGVDSERLHKNQQRANVCGTGAQSDCCDSHPSCPYWASVGECTRNRNYMQLNCMRSCDTCLKDPFARHLARRSGQF
ncbi:hypothetical protein Y032_0114g454 [Ancylostoma ceylanicum]|uniref:ShKT domain-containing protein n=1 Tax=Ancylostoma ceylanicum TaxID=53326 RepID=A0A016TDG7_9BILA|nr:hypothetical protein Y032_0114g454 [Ancylostoma ceylanicum]